MELNDTIDALLEQHDERELFALVVERKRKLTHAKAKQTQPAVGLQLDSATWEKIEAFARRPIAKEEEGQGGLDHLTVTVLDCLAAKDKDADDLLFALLRVFRKCHHMQPHLGPIEGVPQQQ